MGDLLSGRLYGSIHADAGFCRLLFKLPLQ